MNKNPKNKRNYILKEQTDKNVKEYVKYGFTSREISDIFGIHFSTVARSINRQGLLANKPRKIKCTIEDEYKILDLYKSNMTCDEIQKHFSFLSTDQINYIVRKHGETRRNGKRVYFDEDYFESIDTEDKAYFLGLLFADGSSQIIQKSDNGFSHSVSIELNTTDRDVLEKFNKSIKNKNEIYDYSRESSEYKGQTRTRYMSRIVLFSKKMFDDLYKLGKQPVKVESCKRVPDIPFELIKHFLRGYFDGDGCVTITNKSVALQVYGTYEFLNSFKDGLQQLGVEVKNNVHKRKDANVSILSVNNKEEIKKIYNLFYSDTEFYMKRRKNRFDELL